MARSRRSRRRHLQIDAPAVGASSVFARAAEIQAARRDGESTDLPALIEIGAEVGLEPYAVMSAYAETAAAAELARSDLRAPAEDVWAESVVDLPAAEASAAAAHRLRSAGLTLASTFPDGTVWIRPGADALSDRVQATVTQALGRTPDAWSAVERCVLVAVEHEGRSVVRLEASVGGAMRAETRRTALTTAAWMTGLSALGVVGMAKGFNGGDLVPVGIAAWVGVGGVNKYRKQRRTQSHLGGALQRELTSLLAAIER